MAENENPVSFEIHRIYTKDLSFESPKSPEVFKENHQFQINVALDNQTQHLEDDLYEVVLKVTVTSNIGKQENEQETAYIAEIKQAGIFTAKGLNDEQRAHALNSACPNIMFPYARETLSGMIHRGGFPPLHLNPINFDLLYQQQLKAKQEQQEAKAKEAAKEEEAGTTES